MTTLVRLPDVRWSAVKQWSAWVPAGMGAVD